MLSTSLCRSPLARARTLGLTALASLLALALLASTALAAQPPVGLGTADSFAVLAGSTVTNTGPSTINGDLGREPGHARSPASRPGTVNGTIHAADAVALQAQADLTTAYNDAAGRTPPRWRPGGPRRPHAHRAASTSSASSLGLTGALTLDAQGDPERGLHLPGRLHADHRVGAASVNLINGAQPCNVFWQVGSSATLGTTSIFVGNILALTSISMNNGVTLQGRALARNGAVTLINDTISRARAARPGHDAGGRPGARRPADRAAAGRPGGSGGRTARGRPGPANGTALFTTTPRSVARPSRSSAPPAASTARSGRRHGPRHPPGRLLARQRVIATRNRAPFEALVKAGSGIRTVTARVTFSDATPARTLKHALQGLRRGGEPRRAGARPRPPRTPPGFTG